MIGFGLIAGFVIFIWAAVLSFCVFMIEHRLSRIQKYLKPKEQSEK